MKFFMHLILASLGMAFAALVTVGVLFWLALYAAFASVRWLLTGQKPQVLLMWQQIQAMRRGVQAGRRNPSADVVEDAVVREIHDTRQLPRD